jgi:hypothetical protein
MILSDEQWEFTKDLCMLVFFADANGFKLTGGELYRTVEQQALYVQSGLSKTMNSGHLYRLAQDYNIFKDIDGDGDKDYIATEAQMMIHAHLLGDFWRSLDPKNVSGFDWGWDYGHFERKV